MADVILKRRELGSAETVDVLYHDNGDGTWSEVAYVAGSDSGLTDTQLRALSLATVLQAGTSTIGKIITPTISLTDSITRPANNTAYSANKSINCNLTVTGIAYTLKAVTLTSNGHPLQVNDRITVAGVNTGATVTNVDGNWIVTAKDTNTFTFSVAVQPTGTTPQSGLTITGAVAKMLSLPLCDANGKGIMLSRMTLSCQGVAMTGGIRCWMYSAQTTVLVDQSTFTLLNANDAYRRKYIDFYPVTSGAGSDTTFAQATINEDFVPEPGDTRFYFRLESLAANTPVSAAVITLRASAEQLLG